MNTTPERLLEIAKEVGIEFIKPKYEVGSCRGHLGFDCPCIRECARVGPDELQNFTERLVSEETAQDKARIATLEAELLAARDLLAAKEEKTHRAPSLDITPTNTRVDVYGPQNKSAWDVSRDKFVRATHLPTGLFAESSTERNQHANKARAMEKLREILALELTK